MKGLAGRPRSGRPPVFAATVVAQVKAPARSLPAEHGLPLSRWSCQDLASEAVTWASPRQCPGRRCAAGWWLNQIEIYFSIVQRKVIKPGDFTDLTALEHRLLGFEDRYNTTASPFNWRYTKADLNAYLERLTIHEPLAPAA